MAKKKKQRKRSKRKRKHKLTPQKARKILRDGKIRGKPLTAKQKRYFGYIAGGGKPKK